MDDQTRRILRVLGVAAIAAGVTGAVSVLLFRDQITRQRRNLFHPLSLKRMAALEYMARQEPSVDHITLLRDYLNWEAKRLLRNRARAIVDRMENEARGPGGVGVAGA
jgi:hypothetical protein